MGAVTSLPATGAVPQSRATGISPLLLMWGAALALFPLYLFPKGSFQVSDMVMAVVVLLVSVSRGYEPPAPARPVVVAFGVFAWYVLLISIYRTVQTGSMEIMLFAGYYAFNVLRLVTMIRLYARYRERFLRMTLYGILGAVLMLLAISARAPLTLKRVELSFNNPNQLGYFVLLSVIIIYLLTTVIRVRWFVQVFVYLSLIWFAALSLSKAAIVSLGTLGLFAVFKRNLVILMLGLILIGSYSIADPNSEFIERLQVRIAGVGQGGDDSWEARGYGRISEHPEYLILGAGEGDYERFVQPGRLGRDEELHSTLGTLVFAYGIVGAALFLAALAATVRVAGLQASLLLVPVFVYGLSHQGLRFGLFWVVLAMLFCVGHARQAAAAPSPVPALVPEPARRGAV